MNRRLHIQQFHKVVLANNAIILRLLMCHLFFFFFFHFLLVIAGFYRLSTVFHLIAVGFSPDDPASHNMYFENTATFMSQC